VPMPLSRRGLSLPMLVISAVQRRMVMLPINSRRSSVRDIRDGKEARVSGRYPIEFDPIVSKLNTLLAQREDMVERARARAGNFAHSLKTPLTVIDTLLPNLRDSGQGESAGEIGRQTAQLKKHVNRELARARMAAGHGEPVRDIRAVIDEVLATIRQLPRGRELAFRVDVPRHQPVRMEREDFIELIANVLDNARKWSRSVIDIRIEKIASEVLLSISDDGPGIPEIHSETILERGRRLDEGTEGTGIGLAIVKDIADAYGLATSFTTAPPGGLRLTVTPPAA